VDHGEGQQQGEHHPAAVVKRAGGHRPGGEL
jgi:hypothetical protein